MVSVLVSLLDFVHSPSISMGRNMMTSNTGSEEEDP
jgi:hypothetical protein